MKKRFSKSTFILGPVFLFLFIIACVKNRNTQLLPGEELTITQARTYFNEKYQQSTERSTNLRQRSASSGPIYPFWRQATSYSKKDYTYIEVPTIFVIKQSINVSKKSSKTGKSADRQAPKGGIQRLLLYKHKKDGIMKELLVNYVPDEEYLESKGYDISNNRLNAIDNDFNGFIVYTSVNNSPLFMLRIEKGNAKRAIDLNNPGTNTAREVKNPGNNYSSYECWEYCVEYWQETCWDIPDPSPGGPTMECSEPVYLYDICTYECFETDEEYDPGNPGEYPGENEGGFPIPFTYFSDYVHEAPDSGININDFLKCFLRNLGAKVTIYVDQPVPGTRNFITTTNGFRDVGHVFVGIEQTVNGVTTTRFFGYYPSGKVSMFSSGQPHMFGNDSHDDYDVKIETNVTATQLAAILDMAYNARASYDLYSYNCADFGIDIGRAAGLNIPYTKGSVFPGRNPGDLGQDLRNIPGANETPGLAPSNTGNCN
jgi:hypothetical protein